MLDYTQFKVQSRRTAMRFLCARGFADERESDQHASIKRVVSRDCRTCRRQTLQAFVARVENDSELSRVSYVLFFTHPMRTAIPIRSVGTKNTHFDTLAKLNKPGLAALQQSERLYSCCRRHCTAAEFIAGSNTHGALSL